MRRVRRAGRARSRTEPTARRPQLRFCRPVDMWAQVQQNTGGPIQPTSCHFVTLVYSVMGRDPQTSRNKLYKKKQKNPKNLLVSKSNFTFCSWQLELVTGLLPEVSGTDPARIPQT